jgi:hypothetical protein
MLEMTQRPMTYYTEADKEVMYEASIGGQKFSYTPVK